MGELHSKLINQIKREAERYDIHLSTNVVGHVKMAGGWKTIGLGVGSSDLIGWIPLIVQATKIHIAQFIGIEVKTPGDHLSNEQKIYLEKLSEDGGLCFACWEIDDFVAGIEGHFLSLARFGIIPTAKFQYSLETH